MGVWGPRPWDNDGAGDWYWTLFRDTNLAEHIERTLSQPVDEFTESEIRAAVALLILLGRGLMYHGNLEAHLSLALTKTREIRLLFEEDRRKSVNPAVFDPFLEWVDNEIFVLERRLATQCDTQDQPAIKPPTSKIVDWWSEWM